VLGDELIPEMSSSKCLGTMLRSDISWAGHVNGTVKKACKALHFIMRVLEKGNSSTRSSAYTTLVRLILDYDAACWVPYREGQTHALDRVQKRAA